MTHPSDEQDRELRRRLEALRVDVPEGDFQAVLRRRLLAAGPPEAPSRWRRMRPPRGLAWPAVGAAAGAAVFLILASPALRPHPGDTGSPFGTLLPTSQVAVVRLTLSAEASVDAAHIRISLPSGLSFWADGREVPARELEWTQPLDAGDNEIPIAIRGRQPGRYRIGVNARIGEQRIDDEVLIEVTRG
jgi:hypothetical protein